MFVGAPKRRGLTAMRFATTMFVHTSVMACLISAGPIFSADAVFDLTRLKLGSGGRLVSDPAQVLGSFAYRPTGKLKLSANPERERDAMTSKVYALAAPATVLVKAETSGGPSLGTGWIYAPDGWIVTNFHVVAGAEFDPMTGGPAVSVYFGRIPEDDVFMHLDDKPLVATIYKADKVRDLALLRVQRPAEQAAKLPVIQLARQRAGPGDDCVMIGHPAASTLWTIRKGGVVSQGTFPDELMKALQTRLTARGKTSGQAAPPSVASSEPKTKIVLTNCNVNHGDSGGPLLNANGELIGVTFGMPSIESAAGSSSVISYHIHLDEVRRFLADLPKEPAVDVPDPWPPGLFSKMRDEDGDGVPGTLEFSATEGGQVCGLMLDLNQATAVTLKPAELPDAAANHTWQFQFALSIKPTLRAFYATSGSGRIDLILNGRESDLMATGGLRLVDGKWTPLKPQRQKLLDSELFSNATQRLRFTRIMNKLMSE
jgi:serine protease Do